MVKILKLLGRGVKIVGMAVGGGGWAAGMVDPQTGLWIAGLSVIAGDVIVMVGDYSDDGKLNQSFKID